MGIQLSDWVENIVGKGEIALYEQFVVFPKMFSKTVFCGCVKMSIYGVKGKGVIRVGQMSRSRGLHEFSLDNLLVMDLYN